MGVGLAHRNTSVKMLGIMLWHADLKLYCRSAIIINLHMLLPSMKWMLGSEKTAQGAPNKMSSYSGEYGQRSGH
jgi:hypothetical protein